MDLKNRFIRFSSTVWIVTTLIFTITHTYAGTSLPVGFGKEIYCYNGHEGPNCYIRPSAGGLEDERTKEQARLQQEDKENRCHTDSNCVPVGKGMCAIKDSRIAKSQGELKTENVKKTNCRCLDGPVFFGCIPEDKYHFYDSK